jgi:hypothetical protein
MDKSRSNEGMAQPDNPLQPVLEMIQGGDPEEICRRYGISRDELARRFQSFKESQRQTTLAQDYSANRVGRNDPCPCGSGKKYKKCCLPRDEQVRQAMPAGEAQRLEEKAKLQGVLDQEVARGFDLLFAKDYEKAKKVAAGMLETCPEDDRLHDIILNACMVTGDYDEAFRIARRRWQVSVEEKEFHQEHGFYRREGPDRQEIVHFYPPSSWLEKFWVARKARTYGKQFPLGSNVTIRNLVSKLDLANDKQRFTARQWEGLKERESALEPVIQDLRAAGPEAIAYLIPLVVNFSWSSLFVPGLLAAYDTDECIQLLAEVSMFRFPLLTQLCLESLERMGTRVIPQVREVLERDMAFDELKVGLIMLLGQLPCPESFALLTRWVDHDNPYVVHWAAEAMKRHDHPEAGPYLEKAKARLEKPSEIAGAIQELAKG